MAYFALIYICICVRTYTQIFVLGYTKNIALGYPLMGIHSLGTHLSRTYFELGTNPDKWNIISEQSRQRSLSSSGLPSSAMRQTQT